MKRSDYYTFFKELLPFTYLYKYQTWKIGWVRWFLLLSVFPLLGSHLSDINTLSYKTIAFFSSIYFATIWAVLLYYIVQPSYKALHHTLFVASAGSVLGLSLAYFFQETSLMQALYGMALSNDPWLRLLGFLFGVGVLEEVSKALPLLFGIFVLKKGGTPYDVIFIGIVCGLAFGVAESLGYMLGIAKMLSPEKVGDFATLQFVRLITLPLLHALWTGCAAFFIVLAYEHEWCSKRLLLLGLGIPILLHGFYDFFADSFLALLLALLSVLNFVIYLKNAPVIRLRLHELRNDSDIDP